MDIELLDRVIVKAKAAAYVGGGEENRSSRARSRDLAWREGEWRYLDSYFGGSDFIGQEIIWRDDVPVWGMNYYGFILRPDLIDASRAGATIKAALSALYEQGRFLGGFEWIGTHGTYIDENSGDASRFRGREIIMVDGRQVYALDYGGGLVRP
ncbi:DUF5680 domain-containing protein [Rhizobium terrae]|uniref:DUF5680 domain-containing protein n=1 Tax=Rhizobium terrae TaxID=2171756 RepID=UPI000E3C3410|nr:DUF5680 domain-containing protein [Rhizobium terrae]